MTDIWRRVLPDQDGAVGHWNSAYAYQWSSRGEVLPGLYLDIGRCKAACLVRESQRVREREIAALQPPAEPFLFLREQSYRHHADEPFDQHLTYET